jgi:hypothetical protein
MMHKKLTLIFLLYGSVTFAQKKPLDHTVYDTWEAVGAQQLSNNGQWAMFGINQQEGDANLYLSNLINNSKIKVHIATKAQISADSNYAVFAIKAFQKDIRQAKIKKKKADDMPKDSLGIANLTSLGIVKVARVKSFKMPEKAGGLLAYQLEKPVDTTKKAAASANPDKKDSEDFFADDEPANATKQEGTDLIFKNLITGQERTFKYVSEYAFSKNGKQLVFACTAAKKDKTAPVGVFVLNIEKGTLKTLVKGKGSFKNFAFADDGEYLAFVGEQSPEKTEIKTYNVYYNSLSLDTAQILVDNEIPGMPAKWAVSGDGKVNFSKDGTKLFFGIAPVKKAKDTTLVDFENAKLDIWGYKDDYLQPMQLKNAERDSKKSYLTAIEIFNSDPKIIPLTDLNYLMHP